jgi:hypothetical protein
VANQLPVGYAASPIPVELGIHHRERGHWVAAHVFGPQQEVQDRTGGDGDGQRRPRPSRERAQVQHKQALSSIN